MIQSPLPAFLEGTAYRQLPRNPSQYRFETLRPVTIALDCFAFGSGGDLSCRDGTGREWLRIGRHTLTIPAGYAWNGCSPKRHLRPFGWIGTPDFLPTRLASLFHDALYQFKRVDRFPFDRATCDLIFLEVMCLGKFRLANAYHGAVRDFGGITYPWQTPNGEHSLIVR